MSKNLKDVRQGAMLRHERTFWVEGRVKCEGLRWELAKCFQGRARRSERLECSAQGGK